MKFRIEDLDVYFPYEYIYPEQYEYMVELKRTLDAKGHCLLEMPTGTGKTITLLSLITSYQMARKGTGKLVYCTRTVHEMEKALAELRLLHAYQQSALAGDAAAGAGGNGAERKGASGVPRILALGLSSRKNLCIHPVVAGEGSRESVDAGCRKRTASWVRAAALENPDIEVCTYFDQFDRTGQEAALPPGVYTLQDLRAFGREKGWCPYFLARHMINFANVVVYNYQYLLDPKVSGIISRELERESIVVFDEAHNIDNVCIEALSVNVRQQTIDGAHRNLARLNTTIERFKATDAERLKEEYRRLVDGLAQRGNLPASDTWLANPLLPADILQEAVPGNIRRAEHFLAFLRRFLTYLQTRLNTTRVESEGPLAFLHALQASESTPRHTPALIACVACTSTGIESKSLQLCYDRLQSLLLTLQVAEVDEMGHLQCVCDLATLVGTYTRGFAIIIEPYDERQPQLADPVLQLHSYAPHILPPAPALTPPRFPSRTDMGPCVFAVCRTPLSFTHDFTTLHSLLSAPHPPPPPPLSIRPCPPLPAPIPVRAHSSPPSLQLSCLDASLAIRPTFERFQSVIITSGTLSPIDLYPRLLNFHPVCIRSLSMSLSRDCLCPLVVTRGSDQLPLSTRFDMRSDPGVVRNYGRLLVDMAACVPDGIVCFFVSYAYMDGIVNSWNDMGILKEVMEHKLVFIETQDVVETTLALDNYRRACDCGRGGVFFSIARGKVAEGIDFDRHYGRLVIMFGVPFQYTLSRILRARLEYLRETFQIQENDFLSFDAIRQAAQCVGRVIRSKSDYGIMIFADKRYNRHDKRSKLPGWIVSQLPDGHLNLSTDMAVHIAREFLRRMAQPFDRAASMGGATATLLSEADVAAMAMAMGTAG
ncbi:unnamed protein product [Closterium sp. Yama58-4]|nr:unnamed protein product [Closterium sp. Yama58-4]